MATSKTLTPTNVTIQIPAFTDQPDQRVNSNCIDKEADAINALNSNITSLSDQIATLENHFSDNKLNVPNVSFLFRNMSKADLVSYLSSTYGTSYALFAGLHTITDLSDGFYVIMQIPYLDSNPHFFKLNQ